MAEDEELRGWITLIIERTRLSGKCELVWRVVCQVPIPKKGNLADLKNWRPICLINAIVKLSNRIAFNRIRDAVEEVLRFNQYGFRSERSTAGAQACFSEMYAKAKRATAGVVFGFVDFSKAFPPISFASIKEALRAFHIPPGVTNMILSLYNDELKAYVRTPLGATNHFNVDTGTLQGDVLAPFLFILVLDRVLAQAIDGHPEGITITEGLTTRTRNCRPAVRLTDVDFADDLLITVYRCSDLKNVLCRLLHFAGEVNLKINVGPKKTAYMVVGEVPDAQDFIDVPGLGEVPRVREYRHLGALRKEEDGNSMITDRLKLAWGAVHKLRRYGL